MVSILLRLLENGREKMFLENREKNRIEKQKLDLLKYSRSHEPIDLMKIYSRAELKCVCPKKFIADCENKRMDWYRQKMEELVEKTPITKRRVSCESSKYFNELIEEYYTKHVINLKSFNENKKNKKKKNKRKKNKRKKKNSTPVQNHQIINDNQKQLSSECLRNSGNDFPFDVQSGGCTSIERGIMVQPLIQDTDTIITSNVNCDEINTPLRYHQPLMHRIDTTSYHHHEFLSEIQPVGYTESFTSFTSGGKSLRIMPMPTVRCDETETTSLSYQKTMGLTKDETEANSLSCQQSTDLINTTQTIDVDPKELLRSQRPLETMGYYQLKELCGIVPDSAIVAFQGEQRDFLDKNLERELKNAPSEVEKLNVKRLLSL
eukprot:TCONS_00046719-protein